MIFEYAPGWTSHFTWVAYVAFFVAFLVAFGMGANDCANSYGTVVGSGVLKLWKAYVLATIFETLGAALLGYKVTNTMRKSIVNVSVYDVYSRPYYNDTMGRVHYRTVDYCSSDNASLNGHSALLRYSNGSAGLNLTALNSCEQSTSADFILGELGVLIGTAFWLILATIIHLPVSTTHSAVGATIGFSLVLRGADGINWWIILKIVVSWVASPALAGFFAVLFYMIIKYTVFKRAYPFESSLQMMPIFYFFALTVNSFSVLYDGSKYLLFDTLDWWVDLLISLAVGSSVAIMMMLFGKDLIRARVLRKMTALSDSKIDAINRDAVTISLPGAETNGHDVGNAVVASQNGKEKGVAEKNLHPSTSVKHVATDSSLKDVRFSQLCGNGTTCNDSGFEMTPARMSKYQTRNTSNNGSTLGGTTLAPTPYLNRREETAVDARSLKEKLKRLKHPVEENPLAAEVFNYLQILSACFLSFSHGSNDTANAVGPLVGLWLTYKNGHAAKESPYDYSMLLLILFGAVSMIIGLWILGHRVISTIGTKITQVTPPSGFAMELGTGFTVLVASKIGIPVSTTHCAVGAVVCVGWFKSHEGGVSWKIFRNIAIAWVVTLPVASAVAALSAWLLKLCVL